MTPRWPTLNRQQRRAAARRAGERDRDQRDGRVEGPEQEADAIRDRLQARLLPDARPMAGPLVDEASGLRYRAEAHRIDPDLADPFRRERELAGRRGMSRAAKRRRRAMHARSLR